MKKSNQILDTLKRSVPRLKYGDVYMLSRKEFIEKALRSQYESLELARLLTHLSYENYDFSKTVARRALIGINKANSDEIQGYLLLITHLLTINDSFTQHRFEWILGIPMVKIDRTQ